MIAKTENVKINPNYKLVQRIFGYLNSLHSITNGEVGDLASEHVSALRRTDTVGQAVKIMREHGFKQLPVLNGNHNLGSVSERGISRRILETKRPELLLRKRVAAVMDEALPTVSEGLPAEGIIPQLKQAQAALTTKE